VSRLDSFIRRMQAQRDCLNEAALRLAGISGHVLELGFGNGRTYDHLRQLFPEREIYVFDRKVAAAAGAPDPQHLFLGEFRDSLPAALTRLGAGAVLVHADTGSADRAATAAQARWLGPALRPLLRPGGLALSDQPLAADGLAAEPLPEGVPAGRYFIYRAVAA